MASITKRLTAYAYFDGSKVCSLLDKFKVNSPKQAKERFLKKYGAVLIGDWRIIIRNDSGKLVLDFPITEQIELKINKCVKQKKKKTVLQGGKLANQVLNELYADGSRPSINGKPAKYLYRDSLGEVHAWSGRGRKPRWFVSFVAEGGKVADIALNAP